MLGPICAQKRLSLSLDLNLSLKLSISLSLKLNQSQTVPTFAVVPKNLRKESLGLAQIVRKENLRGCCCTTTELTWGEQGQGLEAEAVTTNWDLSWKLLHFLGIQSTAAYSQHPRRFRCETAGHSTSLPLANLGPFPRIVVDKWFTISVTSRFSLPNGFSSSLVNFLVQRKEIFITLHQPTHHIHPSPTLCQLVGCIGARFRTM